MSNEDKITKPFDTVQGLIGEYELKTDKPTVEGLSNFLERRKQYVLNEYRECCESRKQMSKVKNE